MHKKLLPNIDVPVSFAIEHLYKAQPIPLGAGVTEIAKWMNQQGWQGRPIKSLKSQIWLIVVVSPIANPFATWNSKTIMLQEVRTKHDKSADIVVAGNIPKPGRKQGIPYSANCGAMIDPLQINDPWANSSYSRPMPNQNANAASAANRSIQAPTESRLQNQDEKIAKLESAMTELKNAQETHVQQMGCFEKQIHSDLAKNRREFETQIQAMSSKFERSLEKAVTKQESQMATGFSEIKELLAKNNRPKRKKRDAGKGTDEDMGSEGL